MFFYMGKVFLEILNVILSIFGIFVFFYLISLGLYVLIFCYVRKFSVQFGIKCEVRLVRKIVVLVFFNFILFILFIIFLLVYVYLFRDVFDMVKLFLSMCFLFIVGGWFFVMCFNLNLLVNLFFYLFRYSCFKKEICLFYFRL